MIYGYARVSTNGQARDGNSLEAQERILREKGVDRIFQESYTGTKKSRPKLDELLDQIQNGDTLIVTKLDRIARSTRDGLDIIDTLLAKGVNIVVNNPGAPYSIDFPNSRERSEWLTDEAYDRNNFEDLSNALFTLLKGFN